MSYGESLLGMGCLWSVTDYGDMFKRLCNTSRGLYVIEQEIESEIRDHLRKDRTQWIKLLDKDSIVAGAIVVTVSRNGYTVKAHH